MHYLHAGYSADPESEKNQRVFMVNLFGMIGTIITLVMGLLAVYRQELFLALALISSSAGFQVAHAYNRITHKHNISENIILYGLFVLMFYLVFNGGVNSTGPLWIYIVPAVAFFFKGLKGGIWNIVIFISITSFLLFFKGGALLNSHYTFEFKTRLVLSFITVSFLYSLYERARLQSYRKLEKMNEKYEELANTDQLTELPNRRGMRERLVIEFNRLGRSQSAFGLIMCDIDYFKKINDQYGHDMGDQVLKSVASVFDKNIRKQDVVSRWGGEEFLFLLPNTGLEDTYKLAEKLRTEVHTRVFESGEEQLSVSVSMGITDVTLTDTIDVGINRADKMLYQAKKKGRNRTWSAILDN